MASVAICTTTFYPDENNIRVTLACRTIEKATALGIPIVVVDGGSASSVTRKFINRGALVFQEILGAKPGQLGPGRRQCLQEAGALLEIDGYVFWTEPEKYTFIDFIPDLVAPLWEERVKMLIPSRQDMDSYPIAQQHAEPLGNYFLKTIIGQEIDTWFGPMALSHEALQFFLDYDGRYGDKWDSIHIPRLQVIAAGLFWKTVQVEYQHPWEQTKEEREDPLWSWKRLDQLTNMVPAFWYEAHRLGIALTPPPPEIMARYN